MEEIKKVFDTAARNCFNETVDHDVERTEEKFGDFSSNIAMKLASKLKQNPRQIAEKLGVEIKKNDNFKTVEVAGPGFVNVTLSDDALQILADMPMPKFLDGKEVVAEYSDPNPFKILHAGHFYTSVVGDSIANLLEQAGALVHKVNYGGDVGLHVGKTMWAALQDLGGENPEKLHKIVNKTQWMADCYVKGTAAYEEDLQAREAIVVLNKKVYELHKNNDKESAFAKIYWTCRQWSYDSFDDFYKQIGSRFDKYYPESSVVDKGLELVKEQQSKGVYQESNGAVVFDGEKYGLHTRVFINSEGLPTYETKEVGLLFTKKQDFNFDFSVVITGSEQKEYMAVVLKSVEQYAPELVKATNHITHGLVKLAGGQKMSSRKGNILSATDVLEASFQAMQKVHSSGNKDSALGAVKYSFLKQRIGGDIIYDPEESVSMHGNSGPYLQYAHARGYSILSKSNKTPQKPAQLEESERSLLRKISEYNEVKVRSINELKPHNICNYLYELAQSFNRFYEKNRIINDDREAERLWIIKRYINNLADGLSVLGITAPKKM
ncbi:arginine--tRNA ligase [Candidatus Saccharibacteria bacterium]|nr:arginine--tRNA ligase [Candidatus Saccharibacteria bacterium]